MRWDMQNPQAARDEGLRPTRVAARRKKDTKRWCGGKVGREHTPAVTHGNYGGACQRGWPPGNRWVCWHILACSACGKHIEYNVPCPDKPPGLVQGWF